MLFAPGLGNSAVPGPHQGGLRRRCYVVLLWPVVPLPPICTFHPWAGLRIALNEAAHRDRWSDCSLNFIFDAAQFAGQILGVQMGFSLATIIDPQTQADSAVLSVFYQTHRAAHLLRSSMCTTGCCALWSPAFTTFPPDSSVLTPRLHRGACLHTAGAIWVLGLQIAAPALIATVHCRFCIGLYREGVAATARAVRRPLG